MARQRRAERVNLVMSGAERAALEALAEDDNRSMSDIVRRLITREVIRRLNESEARQAS
jgi:hypothetical protein